MDHSENDILISAYLDGELNTDERARAEQLLATSPEARQLLEELRALRAGLQDLPQHRLEIDFAQRVLAQAEQQRSDQTSPRNPAPVLHSELPTTHSELSTPAPRRLPINRRGILWSLVAVAAALLIMVANRESQQNRDAADRVSLSSNSAVPPTNAPMMAQTREQPATVQDAQEQKTPIQSPAAAPPADHIAADLKPYKSPAGAGGVSSGASVSSADSISLGVNDRSRPDQSADLPAAATPAPPPGASLADAKQDIYKNAAGRREPSSSMPLPAASSDLMLVHVEISPQAVQRHDFDQLLAKNHITLAANQFPFAAANKKLDESNSLTLSGKNSTTPALQPVKTTAPDQSKATSSAVSAGDDLSAGQPADVVLVEATPEQIQHVLTDLRQAPQLFASVAVADASVDNLTRDLNGAHYFKRLSSDADKDLQTDSAANGFAQGSVESRSIKIADEKKSVTNQPADQAEAGRTETIAATPAPRSEINAQRSLQKHQPESSQFGVANVQGQAGQLPATSPQSSLGSASELRIQGNLAGSATLSSSTSVEGHARRLVLPLQTDLLSFDRKNLPAEKIIDMEHPPVTAGSLSGGTLNSQGATPSTEDTFRGGGGIGGAGFSDGGAFGGGHEFSNRKQGEALKTAREPSAESVPPAATDKTADKFAVPSAASAPAPATPAAQPSDAAAASTPTSVPTQRALFIFRLGNTSENSPANSIKK